MLLIIWELLRFCVAVINGTKTQWYDSKFVLYYHPYLEGP